MTIYYELSQVLGPPNISVQPEFNCLTCSYTNSSFGGKGRKTAWKAWNVYPVVTEAFLNLNSVDDCLDDATLPVLERFVIIMYDRKRECPDLSAARVNLFTKKFRSLELLLYTYKLKLSAFLQDVKRSIYHDVYEFFLNAQLYVSVTVSMFANDLNICFNL